MRSIIVPLLALASLGLACSSGGGSVEYGSLAKDSSTTAVIGVVGDSGIDLDEVTMTARVDGVIAHEVVRSRGDGPLFPLEATVTAPAATPDAELEVVVRGRGAIMGLSPASIERTFRGRFVRGEQKLAYVRLEATCARLEAASPGLDGSGAPRPGGGGGGRGGWCTDGLTCISGECRSPQNELDPYTADWSVVPPTRCGRGAEPRLEPGVGQAAWSPMADGAPVELECGPQGGVHFFVAARMQNLNEHGITTTISATQPETGIVLNPATFTTTYQRSNDACAIAGLQFRPWSRDFESFADIVGKALDLTIAARDVNGRTATVTRRVQVVPAPGVAGNCAR